MKGLLYKELAGLMILYRKNLVLVALLYGVLAVVQENAFFLYFGIWMMGFYALSTFSLDEQSGWNRYARTLPVGDKTVVGAKFLAALVFMALAVAYALAVGVIQMFLSGDFDWAEFLGGMLSVTAVAVISTSIMLLLAIKFSPEKARNYFLVFFLVIFAGMFTVGKMFDLTSIGTPKLAAFGAWLEANAVLTVAAGLVLAALVMLACYLASCAVYSKREF